MNSFAWSNCHSPEDGWRGDRGEPTESAQTKPANANNDNAHTNGSADERSAMAEEEEGSEEEGEEVKQPVSEHQQKRHIFLTLLALPSLWPSRLSLASPCVPDRVCCFVCCLVVVLCLHAG